MNTCGTEGCTGHLGKFPDCVTEAIWELSLDTIMDFDTGSTDFEGHYSLMNFDFDEMHELEDGRSVLIPAGLYLIVTSSSGAVFNWAGSDEQLRQEFARAEQAYADWDVE